MPEVKVLAFQFPFNTIFRISRFQLLVILMPLEIKLYALPHLKSLNSG